MATTPSVTFSELEAAQPPQAPAVPAATTAAPEPPAPAAPQFTEQDAQTLRTFADAGITIDNLQSFKQAKELMERLPAILKTNPRILTAEIAKADPEAYDKILEAISDEWFETKGQRLIPPTTAQGPASSAASSPDPRITNELASIKQQMATLIAERNAEKNQRQVETMTANYNRAMEDLLAKVPAETPSFVKNAIRLRAQELVYQDEAARNRVAAGTYVDLPKYFAKASAEATADLKASAEKERTARERVESNAGREIVPAAEAVNGQQVQTTHQDPIWGDASLIKDTQAAIKSLGR